MTLASMRAMPRFIPRGDRERALLYTPLIDMRGTWKYVSHMKMIQIRNVPDDIHRALKARAALAGASLSDYLLREASRLAELPTADEMNERLRRRSPIPTPSESPTDAIRAARDGR